jgi:hypothetical protein
MGDASAIPESLYGYSDHCTRGAQQLQDWVRGALVPAIRAFEQGGGTCLIPIDHDVAVHVATAYYTDRDVRRVGHAFQVAGSTGNIAGPFAPTPDDLPGGREANRMYRMSDHTLDIQIKHQAQIDAGMALAQKMGTDADAGNLEWITQQLSTHADDPFFCAGFLNALSPDQIAHLIARRADCSLLSNADAMINALASGAVTPQAAHNLQRALGWIASGSPFDVAHYHFPPAAQLSFMHSLAANPAAARNFVDLLTPQQLGGLLRDGFGKIPAPAGAQHEAQYFTEVMAMLATVQATHRGDPAGMAAFMAKTATAMNGMNLTYIPHSGAMVLRFVQTGTAGSIPPPPAGMNPGETMDWVTARGGQVDALLAPYIEVLRKSNDGRDEADALLRSVTEGAVLNILPWGIAVKTGGKLADDLVIGGLQSVAGSKVEGPYEKLLRQGGKGPLEGKNGKTQVLPFAELVSGQSGQIATWAQLAAHGYIVDKHHKAVKIGADPQHNRQLLDDMTRHPRDYSLRGDPYMNLDRLKGEYDRHLSLPEGSKSVTGLSPTD